MTSWHLPNRRPRSASRVLLVRPRLEVLEGRTLPSTVTNLDDAGPGSLRQAILDTPAAGTVDFQPGLSGVIILTSGELLINKDLTIAGPGANVIGISGNHASRVFEIAARVTVDISGVTIANGRANPGNGGGILNSGTLTLTSSSLSGSSAREGGGIDNNGGTLTITSCTLSGNSVTLLGYGGAIANRSGTLTITSSTLSSSSAPSGEGGGIFNDATVTITSSTLSGNSAGFGGGIDNGENNVHCTLTINNSTLSGNAAGSYGGGIYVYLGTATVMSSTLSGNSATRGGALATLSDFTTTITSSTLSGNSATSSGGGVLAGERLTITNSTLSGNSAHDGGGIEGGPLTIISSTLSGNSAVGSGGGIDTDRGGTITSSTLSGNSASEGGGIATSSGLYLTSCTISGNSASDQGGGIANSGPFGGTSSRNTLIAGNTAPGSRDLSGLLRSQGHNLIGDGTGTSDFQPTDLVGTASTPLDPKLGPLADNGGPTQTLALLPGSLAIAAGDPAGASDTDQRGPGYARTIGGTIDIGAFEVQTTQVFPVTSTNDAGAGSLRQAILDADASPGYAVMTFDLPGSDVPTIAPTSPLPALTVPTFVNGTSQPGFAGAPLIVLSGANAGAGANGLTLAGGLSTVRGLVVNGFGGAAIALQGGGGDLVAGDYLGTDATGTQAVGNGVGVAIDGTSANLLGVSQTTAASWNLISGNGLDGVAISGSANVVQGNRIGTDARGMAALPNGSGVAIVYVGSDNTVGGAAPGAGNLISGNQGDGIGIAGGSGNLVEGNRIGTDASGTQALGNTFGIELFSGSAFSTVGGTAAGAGNVISGNLLDGVGIYSDGNLLEGNLIGTDARGTAALGNQGNGIAIRAFEYGYANTIGGSDPSAGNTIAANGQDGVLVDTGTSNIISQNAIYANAGLGIELPNNGNQDQAAPDLVSARSDGSSTTVAGSLRAAPATVFTVEFFVNAVCDPSGFGQGERFLGAALETTDATGQASFTATLGVGVNAGQFVTATATDPASDTSAFSNCVPVERSASDPGGARRPDAWPAGVGVSTPAVALAPVASAPLVSGSSGTPPAVAFATAARSVSAGADFAPVAAPPAVVGTAVLDPLSADDLAALADNLLGGPDPWCRFIVSC